MTFKGGSSPQNLNFVIIYSPSPLMPLLLATTFSRKVKALKNHKGILLLYFVTE